MQPEQIQLAIDLADAAFGGVVFVFMPFVLVGETCPVVRP